MGGSLDQNSLAEHGFDYRALTALTEAELLHSEYSSLADYGPASLVSQTGEAVEPDPRNPNVQFPMGHQGFLWLLVPGTASRQGLPVGVSGAMFTRAGRELLTIVDIEPMPSFTEQLQQHFASLGYSMIPYDGH